MAVARSAVVHWAAVISADEGAKAMSLRDLIARLGAARGATTASAFPPHVEALVPEAIGLVAEEIEPNLVHLPRFRQRIEPSVRRTIAYLREVGSVLPEHAVELSPKAWSSVVEINTLFATPADVGATLARADELRRWFGEHPGADAAHAWLAAERHERTVLGMARVGDTVQRDVMQTTLSFDQQRVAFPGESIVEARVELGLALFRGLLAIALEGIEASRAHSQSLAERQAMLKVRVRRLKQQQQSVAKLACDAGAVAAEIATAERDLSEVGSALLAAKARFVTLDAYLGEAQRVLDRPGDLLRLEPVPVRVDRMGVQVGSEFDGPVNVLTLVEVRAREFRRVAVLVRCLRADLPPPPDGPGQYARYV
jgi:hypothetical protein